MTQITRRAFLWRTALMSGAAVAGTSLLAACGGGSTSTTTTAPAVSGTPASGATSGGAAAGPLKTSLNVGLGHTLQDLNGFDLDIASYSNQSEIYDTLLTYDDQGKAVPRLAESWTIAQDGASATIKLRQGATFQNGTPVNADGCRMVEHDLGERAVARRQRHPLKKSDPAGNISRADVDMHGCPVP